jgi:hypothetical protein
MIQFQDNPWQQVCPLPLASEPADRGILPGEEGRLALPPVAREQPPAPQAGEHVDDDYQWRVLL